MAGHSHAKNIMHRKGKSDAARSKVFSKLAREITVAAKLGVPDPAQQGWDQHFGYGRLSMLSFAWDAVDDFAAAGEGPDGSAKFKPIAETLKHSIGIKKRWYLAGGGDGWSRNVLIVMDEKNQLWGFMMGYSE